MCRTGRNPGRRFAYLCHLAQLALESQGMELKIAGDKVVHADNDSHAAALEKRRTPTLAKARDLAD